MATKGKPLTVELRTNLPVAAGIPNSGPMTVEEVKEELGWTVLDKESKEEPLFRDIFGEKVVLKNRKANRPLRFGLAKKYAFDFVRGKWRFNGESFVMDHLGQWQDGQHRMVGFVLADQMLHKNPEKWKEYKVKRPLTLDAIIIRGIDPKSDTVDTLGIGQKRTLGDVIYRDHIILENWQDDEPDDKTHVKLASLLGIATRQTWLRVIGKSVSDAPHFPHSEAMDFLRAHIGMVKSLEYVWNEENGSGEDGGRVTKYISLGVAASLHYLMSTCGTDPNEFLEHGTDVLDFEYADWADEFWTLFAAGEDLEKTNAIKVLRDVLADIDAGSAIGREEVFRTVVKAWNLWCEETTIKDKKLVQVEKVRNIEKDKMVLAEDPRLGGLDTEWEMEELDVEELDDSEKGSGKKGGKKGGKKKGMTTHPSGWTVGDGCWVDEGPDSYFGVIRELYSDHAKVEAKDDGKLYDTAIVDLLAEKPGGDDDDEEFEDDEAPDEGEELEIDE